MNSRSPIQQCYRHVFYPSRNRVGTSDVDLGAHRDRHPLHLRPAGRRTKPGGADALRDLNKLRLSRRTNRIRPPTCAIGRRFKKGQISTLALRDEFRRDPALPILAGNDIFIRGVRRGIEQGEYVYRRGDLLFGPDDPAASGRDRRAVDDFHRWPTQRMRWRSGRGNPSMQPSPEPTRDYPARPATGRPAGGLKDSMAVSGTRIC